MAKHSRPFLEMYHRANRMRDMISAHEGQVGVILAGFTDAFPTWASTRWSERAGGPYGIHVPSAVVALFSVGSQEAVMIFVHSYTSELP